MRIFITDFPGTMEAVKLKLGTHMDNELMYPIYWNQGEGPMTLGVTSLDRFYSLPLMKTFPYRFLRYDVSCKVET